MWLVGAWSNAHIYSKEGGICQTFVIFKSFQYSIPLILDSRPKCLYGCGTSMEEVSWCIMHNKAIATNITDQVNFISNN